MNLTQTQKRDMACEALAIWLERQNTVNQGHRFTGYEVSTETFTLEVAICNKKQGFYMLSPNLSTYYNVTLEISKFATKVIKKERIVENNPKPINCRRL